MKKILSLVFSIIMVAGLFSFPTTHVSAAELGTLPSNAVRLTDGNWYNKSWTHQNYRLNCYNRIVVPSRGYITFNIDKPTDHEGEIGSFDLYLYNSEGTEVWACDTGDQKNTFSEYYTYKIGLSAGTYYMNLNPNFYVYSDSAPIYSKYCYTFTAASDWEIESNNTMATATTISLDKTYKGVYAEEMYRSENNYEDYYKVKLTKGQEYRLIIGNAKKLAAGTAILIFYDPYNEEVIPTNDYSIHLNNGNESGNYNYYDFVANYTGYYYLRLYNDGNDAGVEYTVRVNKQKVPVSKLNVKLSATSYTYTGAIKTPSVVVKTSAGKVLKKNTDYTVTYSSGRKNVGTYKVTVTMKGNYTGTKVLYFKINPQKSTVCKYSLSTTNYLYNGSIKTPNVTVKDYSGKVLKKNTDYTVTYASGRRYVGTYKVTVKMKGNYTGTKTLTFKITPAKTTVSKLTAGKKSITVAITKKPTQVTGYQVQYSTSKTFSKATTKTIASYNTTKYTLKNLSANRIYYVRVRTYKKVGTTTYYSGWSTYKYVRTK